ncbi:hypothetical protein NC653_031512 [Populus alba x Populus x berolinensis]|uniref:Uncharacterized protein n=1 Tax=Populus alba x Populus x berolinensis TaxID=444605 RepID=A0AAD6LZR5_9ROSI|nr:hypothetical protein NC653_031512 [Populus alba x Populus x berolinensis]
MSYLLLGKSTFVKREVFFVPDQKTRFYFCQCLIETLGKRRYLRENPQELLHFEADLPTIGCRTYGHVLVTYWANDDNVRKALHVREGSIEEWKRCNYINYLILKKLRAASSII